MRRWNSVLLAGALICAAGCAGAQTAKEPSIKVEPLDYTETVIYHSPEKPGYTSWVALALLGDGTLRCDFAQLTGPKDKPVLSTPVLESHDQGENWVKVSGDTPAVPSAVGAVLHSYPQGMILAKPRLAVLRDGTLIRPAWSTDPSGSGYLQQSTDGGKTWEGKIYLMPPEEYQAAPALIRQLRDGRLILMGGVWKRGDGKEPGQRLIKMMFVSSDNGRTWSKPITLMSPEMGVCEESDFCELPNGDLFWVHRVEHYPDHPTTISPLAARSGSKPPESYWYSDRMQSIARKTGDTFSPEPPVAAPFHHSGFPVVLYTQEGLILHLATDGVYWTADTGKTWTRLNLPGTKYYPKAVQLPDGKIVCVGHIGVTITTARATKRLSNRPFA